MRTRVCLALVFCGLIFPQIGAARDPFWGADPFWPLIHEPAVITELDLSATQRAAYQKLLDDLDLRLFPYRNKSADEIRVGMTATLTGARDGLKKILKPAQARRLQEILLWRTGVPALIWDDVAGQMHYTETQRKKIEEVLSETQTAVTALEKEATDGKPREPLEKKYRQLKADEQAKLTKLLKPEQRAVWRDLIGPQFDVSKLGHPKYKAPELIDSSDWINSSSAISLEKSRGKVVVVHFYASGCINCIHNYPWYQEWYSRFAGKDVVLVGIHTPETESERVSENVRQRATAAKFEFPVLIDGKSENWNAWGNSMWPSVYIIDQQGYVQDFWPGELKWQGNDGEKQMREQIEKLLAKGSSRS